MTIKIVVFEGPAWEPESAVVHIGMLQTMVDSIAAEGGSLDLANYQQQTS